MKLSRAVEKYIEMKRSFGISGKCLAGKLRAFAQQTGDVHMGSVTKANVLRFLDLGRTSGVTWMVNYRRLKAFFQYWKARGQVRELPMPRTRAAVGRPAVMPYIYSVSDMRLLIWGTAFKLRLTSSGIAPLTLRAVLLFLYGTGARIGETLGLEQDDVDLRNNTVTFRRSTHCVRTIPMGPVLGQWLRTYAVSRKLGADSFFMRNNGQPIHARMLLRTFESVRRRMEVSRTDGTGRQPRLRDLRRTFAVRCLNGWIERRNDLRRMLPVLAAYLGHAELSSTEEYLSLVPGRFGKQLSKLVTYFVP